MHVSFSRVNTRRGVAGGTQKVSAVPKLRPEKKSNRIGPTGSIRSVSVLATHSKLWRRPRNSTQTCRIVQKVAVNNIRGIITLERSVKLCCFISTLEQRNEQAFYYKDREFRFHVWSNISFELSSSIHLRHCTGPATVETAMGYLAGYVLPEGPQGIWEISQHMKHGRF